MAERCPAGPEQHWQLYGELKLHCRWVPNLVQEVVALSSQCVSLEPLVLELLVLELLVQISLYTVLFAVVC